VDDVAYEADDEAYNRDQYTLYELTVPYEAKSNEVAAVKDALDETYVDSDAYTAEFEVSNSTETEMPVVGIIAALVILIGILFVLCPSWVEPFLFLFTIGIAVLLNMGTNAFLPGVSDTTY
jgi:predicted RND superfamily exporter protein